MIKTYRNGTSWYRIYSDGWCEQGGLCGGGTTTLLKPYPTTNYTILAIQDAGHAFSGQYGYAVIESKTASNFYVSCRIPNGPSSNYGYYWRTSGYLG